MPVSASQTSLDARARKTAQRVGLIASKSRRRLGAIDNFGGFMLADLSTNCVVAGSRYDLTAEAVIEYCTT
jgi:hypothetical protein